MKQKCWVVVYLVPITSDIIVDHYIKECNCFEPRPILLKVWLELLRVVFDCIHLQMNKFKTNYSFIEFDLIEHHLLFDR